MPFATAADGTDIHYEAEGAGETVAFVPEAGLAAWQWGWQHRAVAGPREALVYDLRGTGRSDAPDGPLEVGTLASDLEAVLADANADRAHLVGLGLGGMIALRYALDFDRARSLVLIGTAGSGDDADFDAVWAPPEDRGALRKTTEAMLSAEFRADQPEVVDGILDWRATGDADAGGFDAQRAAAASFDAGDRLHEVTLPALVLHGGADSVVPADAGRNLASELPRGEWLPFEGAGHLVTVERSRPLNDALLDYLDGHTRD